MSEPEALLASSLADPVAGIGDRLSALREQKKRRISDLARQIGVSPSLISQIERGQSRPSVKTLFAIAEALEVPVDAFFRDSGDQSPAAEDRASSEAPAEGAREVAPSERYMVRKAERPAIDINGGVRWERLTPTQLDKVEFLELVYAPQAESNPDLYRHPGTEMVVVIEGRLDIYVGFEQYELGAGDSICFPSAFPHRYVNPTERTTRAVTTILLDEEATDAPPTKQGRR